MDVLSTMTVAASAMRAQSERMKTIAENLANANSTAEEPGADPYRRRVVTFESVLDRETGTALVQAGKPVPDQSAFGLRYSPGHPAADENGYVKTPNVNTLVEIMDMREAQRAYEANLNVIDQARSMLSRTIELLRR